jgi:flagellar M-ring protein FliF
MAELTTSSAMESLRQMQGLKDVPLLRQLTMFGGVALAVALGLMLFNWSQKPQYVVLYPGLGAQESGEVAEALRTASIDYRIDDASGAVTVAPDRVHEARLKAAAQGLPKAGASGFEMIQQDQGFGVSQFIENARYQLALETELARTVSSLQPVKSARVHLAVPKPSAFTNQGRNTPSASVVVDLFPGRKLEPNQVDSIQHIVASSVAGLDPTRVTVIDQYGRLLGNTEVKDDFEESSEQYQFARRAEADYVRRIESLLAPMLGVEHVSAQVAVDFDFSTTEEARESYRPEGSVVRSEQLNEETRRDGRSSEAQGIPGATSNQPPPVEANVEANANANAAAASAEGTTNAAATTAATPPPPTQTSRSETRNYEVDRTLSHTRAQVGRLRRLSVAVLVDNRQQLAADGAAQSVALSADELLKVESLVKQAVGFDAARGDSVTVQNAPFVLQPIDPLPVQPIWQRSDVQSYARQGVGALIVLVLIMFVLRPLLRQLIMGPAAKKAVGQADALVAEAATAGALTHEVAADSLSLSTAAQTQHHEGRVVAETMHAQPHHAGALPNSQYEERMAVARAAVTQDPKRVAQVVKTWLNEE